uniref:G-protein coupled neuropeptide receptor n=1 Tax=Tetranychus cinnabarinus TaxID=93129 RepID=A0A2L1GE98_TETCI|nr:G-protein coupled neuropeptide receptor [Tetranychus cinnabarinus]
MEPWNTNDTYLPPPFVNDVHRCLPKSSRFDENCLPDSGDLRIPMERPEDMLDPSKINPAFYPIIITHAITFIIGIAGNIVVILTWAGRGKLRSPTTALLVSLAIADLLLLIVYVPLETLEYFAITWDVGGSVCKLSSYVKMLCGISSVLNLVAVSIERFLVIVYPIKARRLCTLSTSRRGLLLVWSLAVILALPVVFTKRIHPITYYNSSTSATAYYCWDADDDWAAIIAIYQLLVMFVVPGVLMVICYFCVIQGLWVSTRTMASMTKNPATPITGSTSTNGTSNQNLQFWKGLKSRNFKVIKMLIFVVLIFLFCWGPRLIINVVIKFGLQDYNQTIYSARVTCYLLSFIHSALNPFIYGFMSTNFRKMMCSSCSHHGQTSQSVNYINNNTGSCSLASGVVPGLGLNVTPSTSLNVAVTPSDLQPSQHQHIHHIIGCVSNSMLNEKMIIEGNNHLPQQMNSFLINNDSVLIDSNSCPGQIEYDLSSYSSSDKPISNHKTVNCLSIKPTGTETL